jgi:predicted pyridoxine 5'-phosphate oxidase superfamily flavin-nucleotide-binding protein
VGVITEDMKRVVREQQLGFVATVCADGTPNLSPKGTTTVWDDDTLVFADIRSPQTVENLRRNPSVEINVVDPILRKGYRFKGTATLVSEGELFDAALASYKSEEAMTPRDLHGRVQTMVFVRVEQALPLVSPGYDSGVSEDEMTAAWEAYWERIRG